MASRQSLGNALLSALLASVFLWSPAPGCAPCPPSGKPVVNADQTVIIIWDAEKKTEHFVRQASFKSEADDFGFLVPTPSEPELAESGNEAFPILLKMTEPETKTMARPSGGFGCGCGDDKTTGSAKRANITVLQEKMVAGFKAVVLETKSSEALVRWLKDHRYAYSPEIEAWAKPYVESGWKITALKVAKDAQAKPDKNVAASALRISFKTNRPLFPYREPDPSKAAA